MAATASQSVIGPAPAHMPRITREILDTLDAQRRADATQSERPPAAAIITTRLPYVFRTKPGTIRNFQYQLDLPADIYVDDKAEQRDVSRWEKRYPNPKVRERLKLLRDLIGSRTIEFVTVPLKCECWYGTADETVAAFIREQIDTNPEWRFVYEDNSHLVIVCGDLTFPNTEDGMRQAIAHSNKTQQPIRTLTRSEAEELIEGD